jgi:acetoacetyl-CoA synthetase
MMWNWLVSSLFTGCAVVLYDGSPSYPDLMALWRLADTERMTHFGTSAKFLASCRDRIDPRSELRLDALRVVLSTGSPLLPEDFDWVYAHAKEDLQLSSISGGTDIISCFMLGNPLLPVFRGEIQCFGLGMDVAALDGRGQPVIGRKGELACRTPFPSMPVGFWNDPDGTRYRHAYFEKVPGTWVHGDYVEVTGSQGATGGIIVYGRSDATLNPGGVRIGTAEIYRLVETLPEIEDSIVVGQPWEGDVRIVLFVKLSPGRVLDDALREKIRAAIRSGATPRHVPKVIASVAKIPYTVSGKKTELAVLDVIQGREPGNVEALADSTALDCYRGWA